MLGRAELMANSEDGAEIRRLGSRPKIVCRESRGLSKPQTEAFQKGSQNGFGVGCGRVF